MVQCRQEGNKAISRNTKEFRSYFWCVERWISLSCVLRYQEQQVFLLISCLSHWDSACLLTWFLQGLASFWLWLRWLSCLSHWSKTALPGRLEVSTPFLQFSLLRRFRYVARWAEMGEFSESLSLFHEVLVTKSWETGNWDGTKCLELQNPLIFFASLIMGSALLPMASNRKEFALLGGTFLFGLGALEMVLRMGGYWAATFVETTDQKE